MQVWGQDTSNIMRLSKWCLQEIYHSGRNVCVMMEYAIQTVLCAFHDLSLLIYVLFSFSLTMLMLCTKDTKTNVKLESQHRRLLPPRTSQVAAAELLHYDVTVHFTCDLIICVTA